MTATAASVVDELQEMGELVAKLMDEHRQFSVDVRELNGALDPPGSLEALRVRFLHLQDALTEHMVVEEFEFYPELARRGLFDDTVSAIMQQHHELTASLNKMGLALRLGDLKEFKSALDDLERVLKVHQPAEEEKLFPLVATQRWEGASSEPPG